MMSSSAFSNGSTVHRIRREVPTGINSTSDFARTNTGEDIAEYDLTITSGDMISQIRTAIIAAGASLNYGDDGQPVLFADFSLSSADQCTHWAETNEVMIPATIQCLLSVDRLKAAISKHTKFKVDLALNQTTMGALKASFIVKLPEEFVKHQQQAVSMLMKHSSSSDLIESPQLKQMRSNPSKIGVVKLGSPRTAPPRRRGGSNSNLRGRLCAASVYLLIFVLLAALLGPRIIERFWNN
jgi:hypothetical protein